MCHLVVVVVDVVDGGGRGGTRVRRIRGIERAVGVGEERVLRGRG